MQQQQAQRAGMDGPSDDHRHADAIQLGDERPARVVDDRDGSWPEAEIGAAPLEQTPADDDDQARALELIEGGQTLGARLDCDAELREEIGELGQLTAVLEQHGTLVDSLVAGLIHGVALPLAAGPE